MSGLKEMMKAFGESGGDAGILADEETAHLVADGSSILSMREVGGIEVNAKETPAGVSARVRVTAVVKNPVHLCFGIMHSTGTQKIKMDVVFEKGASAHFIAHCIFPKARKARHVMDASVQIGENARMTYSEIHYHGPFGGMEVFPKAVVNVGRNGRFIADFSLVRGRAGKLGIDYTVEAGENAVSELTTRIFGHGEDEIKIKEKIILSGENSKGLIKARVAIEDRAYAEVTGITEGNAGGARGHVDCLEIVKDSAVARAVPVVNVSHPLAKVTHEAAIGSVDKRQLETLMAHGLGPDEAVDVIVRGILA